MLLERVHEWEKKMVKIERSFMNVIHFELNFEGINRHGGREVQEIHTPSEDNDKTQTQKEK